jgi:superfamily II DNA helicase RecQ
MQIKIFSIPLIGGEAINDEMNVFLRSKKVLHKDVQLVSTQEGTFWTFCIKYIDALPQQEKNAKIDYKQVLDEKSFDRFSKMREVRKDIANSEAVPAFVVFTDEELAEMAKNDVKSLDEIKKMKGIGNKRIEKYGDVFLKNYIEYLQRSENHVPDAK